MCKKRYAICVQNDGCDDLVLGKTYTVIDDLRAEYNGYLRVVDESGEDYLYPAYGFHIAQ